MQAPSPVAAAPFVSLGSVSIAGRAGHAFTPHAMLAGFTCHARGVEVLDAKPDHVRARVRSKRAYDVDLRARGGRLVAGCTCPARSMGLETCKHVWAALLEVDRRGGLDDLRRASGTLHVDAAPIEPPAASPKKTTKKKPAAKKARRAPR